MPGRCSARIAIVTTPTHMGLTVDVFEVELA
jgi:hypothetical protein